MMCVLLSLSVIFFNLKQIVEWERQRHVAFSFVDGLNPLSINFCIVGCRSQRGSFIKALNLLFSVFTCCCIISVCAPGHLQKIIEGVVQRIGDLVNLCVLSVVNEVVTKDE